MCSVCQELVMYDWATEGVYGVGGGEHVKVVAQKPYTIYM